AAVCVHCESRLGWPPGSDIEEENSEPSTWTLKALVESTRRIRDRIRPTAKFELNKIVPTPPADGLAVQFRFLPWSDGSMKYYLTTILLNDIEYQEEE